MGKGENSIFIEPFDIKYIKRPHDILLNKAQIIESLILYDKIYLSLYGREKTISELISMLGEDIFKQCIKNKIIVFVNSDFSLGVRNKDNLGMQIGTPFIEATRDDEVEEKIDIIVKRTLQECWSTKGQSKKITRLILDNMESVKYKDFDNKMLRNNLLNELRDKELCKRNNNSALLDILGQSLLETAEYDIGLKDDKLIIETNLKDEDDKRRLFGILSGYMFNILYANTAIFTSSFVNSNTLWTRSSTTDIIESRFSKIYKNLDNQSKNFEYLCQIDNVPDIKKLSNEGKIDIKDALKIREKSGKLREFIFNLKSDNKEELVYEYLNLIDTQKPKYDNIPIKTIRFILGCIFPAAAAADMFILPKFEKRFTNNVRVKDLFDKDINNI
ncbi:hypothetical protein [Clostridium fungisolvens]|uniref:Uncharacterized protein n=1 Tax=Clostridium fungisolvens TaxID=1604897 RepID=A0A6V8SKL1_9CLOT|nr:hypothetical protein [Clostridium fungisolvens]GFP77460.1 hypothetical protein bsdtw1_03588 [Clostridium fungisolvens]